MAAFRRGRVCTQLLFGVNTDTQCSLGGMCGAIVTSPFDVVKTRLQSSLFHHKHATVGVSMSGSGGGSMMMTAPRSSGLLYNFVETGHIIRYVAVVFDPRRSHTLSIFQ